MVIKFIIVVLWLVVSLLSIDGCFSLINQPNTIANIIGVILFVAWFCISYGTKCFTIFISKKKNEESSN
jgi:hypothetical protein